VIATRHHRSRLERQRQLREAGRPRVTGRTAGEHLADALFAPLGLADTGFWVPVDQLHRLPAAYRLEEDGLVETEPAEGGFYAGPPPFDVSHAELVSTAADYLGFLRLLVGSGEVDGVRLLSAKHAALMTTDQVPAAAKSPDSFFPGFWDGMGWGFGVGVQISGWRGSTSFHAPLSSGCWAV
jgi:CubicO group peptidase (beta-lactamase class C family)